MKNKKIFVPIILIILIIIGVIVVKPISESKEDPKSNSNSAISETIIGQGLIGIPIPNIADNQWVSDPDSIIGEQSLAKINSLISCLHDETTLQCVVVALNNTESSDVDSFATNLFNYWGIGYKDVYNGVLILLDKENCACAIRTGLGTEKILTDSLCSDILQNIMIPSFSQSDYGNGLYDGVEAIKYEIDKSPNKQLIVSHERP